MELNWAIFNHQKPIDHNEEIECVIVSIAKYKNLVFSLGLRDRSVFLPLYFDKI